jgi:hypothetical protein
MSEWFSEQCRRFVQDQEARRRSREAERQQRQQRASPTPAEPVQEDRRRRQHAWPGPEAGLGQVTIGGLRDRRETTPTTRMTPKPRPKPGLRPLREVRSQC